MTPLQIIFWVASVVMLAAAYMVVSRRNLVHAALFLVVSFLGVAVLFILLEAGFYAVMQVLIYIGAIAIMMIFAVMFTPDITTDNQRPFNQSSGVAIGVTGAIFFGLVVLLGGWDGLFTTASEVQPESMNEMVGKLGIAFFAADQFLIPVIVASVLLLGGFIAALVVALPDSDGN
jgi:NADH-quinone oxidoreductase subunit J